MGKSIQGVCIKENKEGMEMNLDTLLKGVVGNYKMLCNEKIESAENLNYKKFVVILF